MTESELYRLAKRHLYKWEWDRVESLTTSGQPDCILSAGYIVRRVELKIVRHGEMKFEPSQISWANRMKMANVRSIWVLAIEKETPFIFPYHIVPLLATVKFKEKKFSIKSEEVIEKIVGWNAINKTLKGVR